VHEVGHDEAGTAVGGVARGDGSGDNAEDGEEGTDAAHPRGADHVDEEGWVAGGLAAVGEDGGEGGVGFVGDGGRTAVHKTGGRGVSGGELDGGGSPDEGNDALGNHGAVEDEAAAALILQTARHQGRLRAVESTDGSAGDGDAEEGEDGQALGMMANEGGVGDFGNPAVLREDAEAYAQGHNQQRGTEEGIETADEGVDGQQCGQHAIEEDEGEPQPFPRGEVHAPDAVGHRGEQAGGGGDEDSADQDEQHDTEHAHSLTGGRAQLIADHLGQRGSVLT